MTATDRLHRRFVTLFSSDARRAITTISGATLLAQVIAAAATPLLTRLYSTDEYGAFFIVFSLSVALGTSFALRLESAVPLPRSDADARTLVAAAVAVSSGFLFIVLLLTVLARRPLSAALALEGTPWVIVLIGPLAASFGLAAVFNAVALRESRYRAIATRSIVVGALTVALQVAAGVAGYGLLGLAASALVAQIVGVMALYLSSPLLRARDPLGSYARVLRRYRRFPLFLGPAGLINSLGENAPLLVVGALYGAAAAGRFGLTVRIVALPVSVVGAAIAQVFSGELARRRREDTRNERELFIKTSRTLAVLAVGFGAVLALTGSWAFSLAFGPEWAQAGDMARAFALAAAAQIVASPVSQTLVVYERPVAQFLWDTCRLTLTVGSVVAARALGAPVLGGIWILSVVVACCYAANWELCRRTVNANAPRAALDPSV